MYLATDPAADELLDRDPLALLIGMMLDQQVPMEKAFRGPYDIRERLGHDLDAGAIAAMDPERLTEIFSRRPAIHRFPGAMAKRAQALCALVAEKYNGDAEAIWREASDGEDALKRLSELPGFGKQKAQIFLALLGKQRGIKAKGWREAAGPYGESGSFKSVADIVDDASLSKVRDFKKQMKAAAKAKAAAAE
jgi:uncharacterized HhH-GPD family protein